MMYPTAPWKIWEVTKKARAKQLREGPEEIKKRGGYQVFGSVTNDELLKLFDVEYSYLPGEPYGAQVALDAKLSLAACEEVEKRGYAGDLCGYLRHWWGCMWLNRTPWGEFPKPDFCIEGAHCDTHNKWQQLISDYFKVPYFVYDEPEMFNWWEMPKHAIQYRYDSYMEIIKKLEEYLGKKPNAEKACKHVVKKWDERVARNKTLKLMFESQPPTMDIKTLYSLMGPGIDRGPEFGRLLNEEIKERIANGISAISNWKMTMMHDNIPPWYNLNIFRYMEKWGVVCIPSHYMNQSWFWDPEEKKLVVGKTYAELGRKKPETLEEAVWDLASWPRDGGMTGDGPRDVLLAMAKQFPIHGAIFHLNKGCEGWSRGRLLAKVALERELSLPCITYEGSGSDRRDFNEAQVKSRLDAFFENLGLKKED